MPNSNDTRTPAANAGGIAVIVPVLNEAENLPALFEQVISRRARCVLADGGSTDDSQGVARRAGVPFVVGQPGRAVQMNRGAAFALENGNAKPSVLLFLHADVRLPENWVQQIAESNAPWGRFNVCLVPNSPCSRLDRHLLRLIGWMMNRRSALTGICTGDQAIWMTSSTFTAIDGFKAIELMEDIDISARLRSRVAWPAVLPGPVHVSARRWHRDGVIRTVLSMWSIRLRYFLGESPLSLRRRYYG